MPRSVRWQFLSLGTEDRGIYWTINILTDAVLKLAEASFLELVSVDGYEADISLTPEILGL